MSTGSPTPAWHAGWWPSEQRALCDVVLPPAARSATCGLAVPRYVELAAPRRESRWSWQQRSGRPAGKEPRQVSSLGSRALPQTTVLVRDRERFAPSRAWIVRLFCHRPGTVSLEGRSAMAGFVPDDEQEAAVAAFRGGIFNSKNRTNYSTDKAGLQTPQLMRLVVWKSGKIHISADGCTTVCGASITPERARVGQLTDAWPERVNCFNCAYRHPPAGYVQPRSSRDFPLKKVCPSHPERGISQAGCPVCSPLNVAQNWPCPNGCTDPRDHSSYSRYTRCTVSPPRNEVSLAGRCVGDCESTEQAMKRANPRLWFDLADSASAYCYHCGEPVCIACQTAPVEASPSICLRCG